VSADLDFHVIDESSDWIVVDKPAPLIVHPSSGGAEPTLLGGLRALLACELADGGHLSILTRLDRETSGLVLVAKHREAARVLSAQFERRGVRKEYLALVHGWPEEDELRCDQPILRAGEVEESPIWVRQRVHPDGKACSTRFFVEQRFERDGRRFARVRCHPESGRMHQIRVHLEDLGHAIVGDKLYGTDGAAYLEKVEGELSEASVERLMLPRQALHACFLSVEWAGEILTWESRLPLELARFSAIDDIGNAHGC